MQDYVAPTLDQSWIPSPVIDQGGILQSGEPTHPGATHPGASLSPRSPAITHASRAANSPASRDPATSATPLHRPASPAMPAATDPKRVDPEPSSAEPSAASQLPATDPRCPQPAAADPRLLDPRRAAAASAQLPPAHHAAPPAPAAPSQVALPAGLAALLGGGSSGNGPTQNQIRSAVSAAAVGGFGSGAISAMLPAGLDLSSLDQLAAALGVPQAPSSIRPCESP